MAKGLRDNGELINREEIRDLKFKTGRFQKNIKQATWFERVSKTYSDDYKKCNAHWVARALALPTNVSFDPEKDLLWVSGVETWKRLAERGLWVHGTSDSLGEQEAPRIEFIDTTQRHWCKWTHTNGEEFTLGFLVCTYELVPKKQAPFYDPECDHFFWMSGSSFERAISEYPWLLDKNHWSGPGNTHKRIQALLESYRARGQALIALNLEQWQKLDS